MFKPPTESEIPKNNKMTPTDTVKALYSLQWNFYRDNYYKLLKLVIIQLFIIVVLGVSILFFGMNGNPEPKYFFRNSQNQIVEMQPLLNPTKTHEQIRQFVTDAILESMNFSFDDYKYRLQKAAVYYTDNGFSGWDEALRRSTVYKQLDEKNLLMRTSIVNVPQIDTANSKAYNGRYIWIIYVDVMRTMSNKTETLSQPYRYKVYVQNVPPYERASGLAIYSIKEEQTAVR